MDRGGRAQTARCYPLLWLLAFHQLDIATAHRTSIVNVGANRAQPTNSLQALKKGREAALLAHPP